MKWFFLEKTKSKFEKFTNDAGLPDQQPTHHRQPIASHDGTSDAQHQQQQETSYQPLSQPTPQDIFRYRYHHGTNLGSIFIQERWLTPSMFPGDSSNYPGSSELAAAEANIKTLGIEAAKQKFSSHWRDFTTDADLDYLRDVAKCTTVRLPIGYFSLGPAFCKGTPFEHVAGLYEGSWAAVKDLVKRLYSRGIGVLIDLHGLPGGANAQEHSGTNSGKAEFWGKKGKKNRDFGTRVVCFVAKEMKAMEGVAGVQIVNESEWEAEGMYEWYEEVLREVGRMDADVPIYVSDGWNLERALTWSQKKNVTLRGFRTNPVVVDTHLYWCFDAKDVNKSPYDTIGEAWERLRELEGKEGSVHDRGAAQVVVGEYSCVLAEEAWQKGNGATKEELVTKFGNAQSQRFQHRAGGSFFWTYKMDWMPGGEWGFQQMTDQGAILPPPSLTLAQEDVLTRTANARSQCDGRKGNTWGTHCHYWDSTHPGHYEHWRFEKGFEQGWNDALAFFNYKAQHCASRGGDKIGMLDLWVLKRLCESGQGGQQFAWEWEVGFRQGVGAFYEAVGV
ncbi:glycoside hydrolase family 5 protein [Cercospora zeae-maydis SCOH1-5]|uniref:Glycoside hydrolase family 5 protein n=1 Tax=Cercospora zeae-maydis SCOH1-5 TaxID=717836 RepID=A0A6A6FCC5_9PEZI|nr:glycoside hydrolase family 5 protein [Cercospora zeae-maydis SCOH1-5]